MWPDNTFVYFFDLSHRKDSDIITIEKNIFNNIVPPLNEELHGRAFPEIVTFIKGDQKVKINNEYISPNSKNGGSLLMRPVGQDLLSIAFVKFNETGKNEFKKKLKKIDFNLSHSNWRYVFWNDKMLGQELRLKKGIILELMGKPISGFNLEKEMKRVYKLHNQTYNLKIEPV